MKVGDLVKRKEGYMGHKMCGVGLVLFADGIVAKVQWQGDYTACGRVTLKVKVRWQGDYGTFSSPPESLELLSEAR